MDFCVLEYRYFLSPISFQTSRVCRDFEFDLEMGNRRRYTCNGQSFKTQRGDILVRKPGDICESNGVQNTYVLTLDFVGHVSPENYSRNLPGSTHPPFQHECINDLPPVIRPENDEVFLRIYSRLLRLSDRNSPAAKALIRELLFRLNAEVCREQYEAVRPQKTACDKVLAYLRENLHQPIILDDLADLVHLEKSYLSRLFRKTFGKTPIQALIELRMEKAMDLVTNTDMKIGEIASLCGYRTPSFFISEYKKLYGATPETHRKAIETPLKNEDIH